jgi:hypothetical protein
LKALLELLKERSHITDQLIQVLKTLKLKAPKVHGLSLFSKRWRTFRDAFNTIWKSGEIERLVAQLEKYKSQVMFRTIACINEKFAYYNNEQKSFSDQNTSKILEVLAFNQRELVETLGGQSTLRRRLDSESNNSHQSDHLSHSDRDGLLAVILTLNNGATKFISRAGASGNNVESELAASRRAMRIDIREKGFRFNEQSEDEFKPNFSFDILKRFDSEKVLDHLYFRFRKDRYETISQNYQSTFKWVFNHPIEQQQPWDQLGSWPASDHSYCWINGKLASG